MADGHDTHDHPGGPDHGDHGHAHGPGDLRSVQRRALWIALVANGGFLGVEVAGGIIFGSLALLADAAHMISDVAALIIALIAQQLMGRPATSRHTYGLQRAEVLGAQINGLSLLAVSGWIIFEAIHRLGQPVDIAGGGMLAIAAVGLAINLASAVVLARSRGTSLNMHGAFVHMAADAAGSVAAIAAGVVIVAGGPGWVDAAASIAIALLVVWSAWGLLRDTTNVLLEGTPRGLDPDTVEAALSTTAHVESVHHLHLWNLASDVPALSGHLVLTNTDTLHDAQVAGDAIKTMLTERFGITHATLELECHGCDTLTPTGHPSP